MLASLLLNLGKTGLATFLKGARLTFRPHAPEVYLYESEEWQNPQGKHGTTIQFQPDIGAEAKVFRARPEKSKDRVVTVETGWSGEIDLAGSRALLTGNMPFTDFGQEVNFTRGAKTRAKAVAPKADGSWSVVAAPQTYKKVAVSARLAGVSAGATVTLHEADFNSFYCNPPEAAGIKNPSPAEIISMVQAVRRNRLSDSLTSR